MDVPAVRLTELCQIFRQRRSFPSLRRLCKDNEDVTVEKPLVHNQHGQVSNVDEIFCQTVSEVPGKITKRLGYTVADSRADQIVQPKSEPNCRLEEQDPWQCRNRTESFALCMT